MFTKQSSVAVLPVQYPVSIRVKTQVQLLLYKYNIPLGLLRTIDGGQSGRVGLGSWLNINTSKLSNVRIIIIIIIIIIIYRILKRFWVPCYFCCMLLFAKCFLGECYW